MLGADNLFRLERWLDDEGERDSGVILGMNEALAAIYLLPEYQSWLNRESSHAGRFQLPVHFGANLSTTGRRILERFGLINGTFLEVKIDKHGNRIHLTDGGWVPSSFRVYPYSDESQILCSYIHQHKLANEVDLLLDPACGCGHHGLALSTIPIRAYLDINLRALAFCRINSILSSTEQMLSGLNDIRQGFPLIFNQIHSKSALVVVNMPFAIHPKKETLPPTLAQDGGDRGVALTFAALNATRQLASKAKGIEMMRLVILFYSLGSRKSGSWHWEVEDRARAMFPGSRAVVTLLEGERMWRVNGVKAEPNPMPLGRMKTKAQCRHTFLESQASDAEAGYVALTNQFANFGYTHLGYGILDIQIAT
jgi:hypothetical protein